MILLSQLAHLYKIIIFSSEKKNVSVREVVYDCSPRKSLHSSDTGRSNTAPPAAAALAAEELEAPAAALSVVTATCQTVLCRVCGTVVEGCAETLGKRSLIHAYEHLSSSHQYFDSNGLIGISTE